MLGLQFLGQLERESDSLTYRMLRQCLSYEELDIQCYGFVPSFAFHLRASRVEEAFQDYGPVFGTPLICQACHDRV